MQQVNNLPREIPSQPNPSLFPKTASWILIATFSLLAVSISVSIYLAFQNAQLKKQLRQIQIETATLTPIQTSKPTTSPLKMLKLEELNNMDDWEKFKETEAFSLEFGYPPSWGKPERAYHDAVTEEGTFGDQGKIYGVYFPQVKLGEGLFRLSISGVSEDFTASRGAGAFELALWGWDLLTTSSEKLAEACRVFNARNCQSPTPRIYTLVSTPNTNCGDGGSYFGNIILIEFPTNPINIVGFDLPMVSDAKGDDIYKRFPLLNVAANCQKDYQFYSKTSEEKFNEAIDQVLTELNNPENNDEETNYYLELFPKLLSTIKID